MEPALAGSRGSVAPQQLPTPRDPLRMYTISHPTPTARTYAARASKKGPSFVCMHSWRITNHGQGWPARISSTEGRLSWRIFTSERSEREPCCASE